MVERTFSLGGGGEPDATGATGSFSVDNGDGSRDDTGADQFGAFKLGAVTRDDGDDSVFDPERHVGPDKRNANGSYTRKRGRKAGAGNTSRKAKAHNSSSLASSIDALTGMLVIAHTGLASVTKVHELAIDEGEGRSLAMSLANVLDQYDITPDPKVTAMVGLIFTAGTIYGPRVYLYRERIKQEKLAKRPSATVVPLHAEQPATYDPLQFTPPDASIPPGI